MATLVAQREAQRLGSLADSPRAVSRLFSGSDDATVALLVPNPLQQLAEGQKDLLGAAARVLVAACLPRPSDLMRDCGDGAGWEQRGDPLSRFQAAVDEVGGGGGGCTLGLVVGLVYSKGGGLNKIH